MNTYTNKNMTIVDKTMKGDLVLITKPDLDAGYKTIGKNGKKERKEKKEKKPKTDDKEIVLCQVPYLKEKAQKTREYMKNKKLCLSVVNGLGECSRPGCTFAHSLEDLDIENCLYKNKCNMILVKDGEFSNKIVKDKKSCMCTRRHDKESLNNYFIRTELIQFEGIKVLKVVKKPYAPYVPKMVKADVKTEVKTKADVKTVKVKAEVKTVKVKTEVKAEVKVRAKPWEPKLPKVEVECLEDEDSTFLEIPKELTLEALKILLASGKNIKIKFA